MSMAIYNAADLNTKNRHMGGYGNAVVVYGSVTPTAAIFGDVYRPVVIPAGLDVTDVDIVNDDLDTGGAPTISCKVGFAPLNAAEGPAAVDDYFASAGKTFLNAAGRTSLAFPPIKFEKPVFLILTITGGAAAFASGKVTAIVKGDGVGVK
jgi:hypothetical protein